MEKDRMNELLRNAARCFYLGYNPFCLSELTKMNVTSDECRDLSALIATIIEDHLEAWG